MPGISFRMPVLLAAMLSVAACTPMVWVKPGATTADFNKDKYRCTKEAARMYGTRTETEITRGHWSGDTWIPGSTRTYDGNQGVRSEAETQCLRARGWDLVPAQQR